MSAPPRADFVAGCPDCGQSREADTLEVAACFYTSHRCEGHDAEWLWSDAPAPGVEPEVTAAGSVANLGALVDALADVFRPARVPAELLYETCITAGAEKCVLDDQLSAPSTVVAGSVTPLG